MIELAMVHRMIKRGLMLAPAIVVALAIAGGLWWGVSAAIGIALTLANLWFAGRIIGGVAENSPMMLMPAALGSLMAGLLVLTLVAVGVKQVDQLSFPVTGITLLAVHVVVVSWEAATTLLKLPKPETSDSKELVHGA